MTTSATIFSLEKPARGSYFGSWHTPVNANMTKIEDYLKQVNTSNASLEQEAITDAGTPWWDTAAKFFYIHNGTNLVRIVTRNEFVLELGQQQELIAGPTAPATSLHWHAGDVSKFYIVKDPTLASGVDLANKNNFAVPYKLFNDTVLNTNSTVSNMASGFVALTGKVNGIMANGIDITIGNMTATGSATISKGVIISAGTTSGTIKIGGGASATENEIIVSKNLPVNIKTSAASADGFELQVQGNKVWTAGNMGSGSGLIADKVDNCDVNDTVITTTNLWTAAKIADAISNGIGGVDIPDTSGFATIQNLQDHKTSSDHDSRYDARYPKKSDIFNVMVGGTILFDTDMVPDWATHFDGSWTGLVGSVFDGWKICTGTNGTKNLIDKFVLGGGPGATFPTTGGASEVSLDTETMPHHVHTIDFSGHSSNVSDGAGGGRIVAGAGGADIITSFDTQATGGRANVDTTTGSCKPHNNMPPYVAMVYMTRYK